MNEIMTETTQKIEITEKRKIICTVIEMIEIKLVRLNGVKNY